MPEAGRNPVVSTEKKKREISSVLNHFYMNPVAKASMELFLTFGLILFLGIFAIKPTIVTMSDLLREIEEKQELNDSLTKKIAALQTAQTQYITIQNQLPLVNTAIPEQPEIILSLKIIEKIAADSQIIIKNMSVAILPENIDENISFTQKSKQNLLVTTSVTADYLSIREFVENLRNSRKSFVVESIVFSLEEDRGNKKLSANISIAIPYFGLDNETAKK
jgi:hypothetical protein